MCDRTIRLSPSLFLNDFFLAFLVQGIHGLVARYQIHIRLVFFRLSGIAIDDGNPKIALPSTGTLFDMIHRSSHPLRMDVAFLVLPTGLQDKKDLSSILTVEFRGVERGAFHQLACVRNRGFIIEHKCFRPLGEGNAPVHEGIRVADASDGLKHLAPID